MISEPHTIVNMAIVGFNPNCGACYETFARALWSAWWRSRDEARGKS